MMKRKWIAAMSFGCLLAVPPSTGLEARAVAAEIPKNLTVDACEGDDFHRNFGTEITYGTNSVSLTKGGTYPNDPNNSQFGCPNDTPETLLGDASVISATVPVAGTFEEIYFHFTSGPLMGEIIAKGDGFSLSGNGVCASNDLAVIGGTGAFAGITGVAHITPLEGEVCQVVFSRK